jgi:hypothetical protein
VRARVLPRLLALVLVAAALVVGGFPGARPTVAAPLTEVRRVSIPAPSLAPSGRAPARLTPDGRIVAAGATTTAPAVVCAPIWFTALGVTWEQQSGTPPTVHVATGTAEDALGRGHALDAEGGPDPGTPEYRRGSSASELLWTGERRCARVAVELPAGTSISDVGVSFINSSGTEAGPGRPPQTVSVPAGPAGDVANAMTRTPPFITRQQWGADPRLMKCTPDVAPEIRMGFVHHTAGTNDYSRAQSDDVVRAIYAYHTKGRGWCDIGYNFLVDRFGRAYEGRSGGMTTPVIGAAQEGFNTDAFSVALMGTFSTHHPSRAMMRTLRRVLAWRLDVAHVPPGGRAVMVSGGGSNTRYPKGKRVKLPVISPHRATGYTECPGNAVVRRLSSLRDAVARAGLPKIYRPSVSPAHVVADSAAAPSIRASASSRLRWDVSVRAADGSRVAGFRRRSGQRLRLTWSDDGSHPLPTAPGRYDVVIEAHRRGGAKARAAHVAFRVESP